MYYTCYAVVVEQVPVRALNQDTAGVMARVERGESVEITRRGRVVGVLVPPGPAGELDDWIAAGRAVPATVRSPFTAPTGQPAAATEAGRLLQALRDEERW